MWRKRRAYGDALRPAAGTAGRERKRRAYGEAPLNAAQKELVERNIALVGLHIRRRVRRVRADRSDCEYKDLFQEGCCGLIQAARSFDPASGIPFAAYALPRIHTAVSTALQRNASLVRLPRVRRRRRRTDPTRMRRCLPESTAPHDTRRLFRVISLTSEPLAREERHDPHLPTIGERLAHKLDLARDAAVRRILSHGRIQRPDRGRLVQQVVDERLRIAEDSERTALRRIARETGSSYTRVLQCERRLHAEMRRMLSADLEFQQLRRMARRCDHGQDTPLDAEAQGALRALALESIRRAWALAPARGRLGRLARRVNGVLEGSAGLPAAPGAGAASAEQLDDLFIQVAAKPRPEARRRPHAPPASVDQSEDAAPTRRPSSGRCRARPPGRGHGEKRADPAALPSFVDDGRRCAAR